MIRTLSGTVLSHTPTTFVLDVHGVGYYLYSPHASESFPVGINTRVYTHLAVRENALDLYGFLNEQELQMFELLLLVPKIGPKSALSIMERASTSLLQESIIHNDAGRLQKLGGVGKKTAEAIVSYLVEKIHTLGSVNISNTTIQHHDAIDALISLGYSEQFAREAVRDFTPETDITTIITTVLRKQ